MGQAYGGEPEEEIKSVKYYVVDESESNVCHGLPTVLMPRNAKRISPRNSNATRLAAYCHHTLPQTPTYWPLLSSIALALTHTMAASPMPHCEETRYNDTSPDVDDPTGNPIPALHNTPAMLIPLELWLGVFRYLPPIDLCAATLACSPFRWLAQPLLFTVIDVSPFFLAYDVERRILRPQRYLERTTQRLEFYRSAHIAPAVKHCWISPYSRTGFPPRNPKDYLDPELIIDKVIDTLPFFPNLRILSWHCINFSVKWWNSVQRLPIQTLWVNSCTVFGKQPSQLPVRHLDLDQWAWEGEVTNHASIHEEHSSGVSQTFLSLVLDPEYVEHITVPRSDTCMRLLSTMAAMSIFMSLRVLRIPFSVISSPEFTPALNNCPALEELRILTPVDAINEHDREMKISSLPPSSLSLLSIYEGPSTLLLTFSQGRPLKEASIWGLDEPSAHCNPTILDNVLQQFSLFNTTLEALNISISHITSDILATVGSFSLLNSLEITSGDNSGFTSLATGRLEAGFSTVNILYINLRNTQLPSRIRNLRLSTKLSHGNLDMPTQQAEASCTIEHMASTYSFLQHVEIGYGTYWTGNYVARWQRSWNSHITDHSTTHLGHLTLKEHRRTIVFPDAQRVASDSTEHFAESPGTWRFLMWARRLLRGLKYV